MNETRHCKIVAMLGFVAFVIFICLSACATSQTRQERQQQELNDALIAAVKSLDAAKVSALLKQGADPNAFENVYQPPTQRKFVGDPPGIDRRRSALLIATSAAEPVRHLISPDADEYEMTLSGYHSGKYETKKLPVVKLLVTKGANVNEKGYMGRTALLWTVRDGYPKIVKFLLSHGAIVNLKDMNGDTALHIAVRSQDSSWVKFLVGEGAQVNVKNKDGDTPLKLAQRNEDTKSIRVLKQAGAKE